jgi:hypothetical protein
MKNIKKYLSRNDIKTLAHHFNVHTSTVQRALAGGAGDTCKAIRSHALNMAISHYEQFQKDLNEFKKEFENAH